MGEQFSPTSTSVFIFLGFAFTAIFIVLSLFLSILSESQDKVRQDEAVERDEKKRRIDEEMRTGRRVLPKRKKIVQGSRAAAAVLRALREGGQIGETIDSHVLGGLQRFENDYRSATAGAFSPSPTRAQARLEPRFGQPA